MKRYAQSSPSAYRLLHCHQGNIEYKLKLTHISPARFARLVTQLKWRLLEGSGQAYYELGVADSGALIGLSRTDLEASLETLDRMAGEIGASVIVVKEIEVPPAMYVLAEEASRYIDPRTGEWSGRMHARRRGGTLACAEDDSTATETTETETELDTTDADDEDDTSSSPSAFISALATPADSSRTSPMPGIPIPASFAHRLTTNPNRPSPQSSPYIAPFDDDLAMFSMEPEPPHLDIDDSEDALGAPVLAPVPLVVDLEIASVYKPRPFRRSEPLPAHTGTRAFHGRAGRRAKYEEKEVGKAKKVHPWQTSVTAPTKGKGDGGPDPEIAPPGSNIIPNREETKAALRRQTRERRREEKRRALLAASGLVSEPTTANNDTAVDVPQVADEVQAKSTAASPVEVGKVATSEDGQATLDTVTEDLVLGLGSLHVGMDASESISNNLEAVLPTINVDAASVAEGLDTVTRIGEPRLIVEALVVRKQSLEETFVDLSGFQLV